MVKTMEECLLGQPKGGCGRSIEVATRLRLNFRV